MVNNERKVKYTTQMSNSKLDQFSDEEIVKDTTSV